MIKYIYDEDGNKTDVQIPLMLWEKLKIDSINSHFDEEFTEINQEDDFYHTDYLLPHYIDILAILLHDNGKNTKDAYENYFNYYDTLSAYDIELLYIFRGGVFFNPTNSFEEHSKILYNTFTLTTQRNQKITEKEFNDIVTESHRRNEISFLQYFKINFKINRKVNVTRLNRKTERDRLFIFDMLHSTYILESIAIAKNLDKTKKSITLLKKELLNALADFFYNGNKAQIYRAQKEVIKRIDIINTH
ncbi:MAG: hypothetical protein K8R39_12475 [Arcobacteraceae bacterium]|nr:hypothetical protein [Arcobacteraceae bacterium]